ncbi:MAG: HypC/HybG/HupF family hydrogenase formation chaperone [Acidimicrobiales bacterium]
MREEPVPQERWADDLALAAMALARRFAAGGTLWCWSPAWPQHAEHIAVAFVHPVIVGKRALPAVAVSDGDAVAALRASAEAGDMIVVVYSPGQGEVDDLLRRAPAWGVETIWIGSGGRPAAGRADHLLWCEGVGAEAPFNGPFVLTYHVLWELTHVCFEHPGLLGANPECGEDHCITCSDEGRLAEVIEVAGPSTVRVRTAAGVEEVDTTLVEDVDQGELVLVHAGVAISRVESGRA